MRSGFPFLLLFPLIALSGPSVTPQLAMGRCKFPGNVFPPSAPSDFKAYWNQVTPENAGTWGSAEAIRDAMSWTGLDKACKFAKVKKI